MAENFPAYDRSALKHLLKKSKLFLFDMDGTLYLGNTLYTFTLELLKTIREKGKNYLFITNNSSKSVPDYVAKLAGLGITATESDFVTSAQATIHLFLKEYKSEKIYVCGTASLVKELEAAGLTVTDKHYEATLVLMGFDTELSFKKLEDVSKILCNRDVPYFATNPDMTCPTEYGYVPDCGSVCDMIYNAAKKRPVVIGKPTALMPNLAMERMGVTADETVVVGDSLMTDIPCGLNAKAHSVCVFTGHTTPEILEKSEIQPEFALKDGSILLEILKEL